jgi:hypothetical protein
VSASTFLSDDPGTRGEQPFDEVVLTPYGWVPIGWIEVGAYVIGSNGKPTSVLGVYPQGLKRVFRVTLEDGRSVRCGDGHLWDCVFFPNMLDRASTDRIREGRGVRSLREIRVAVSREPNPSDERFLLPEKLAQWEIPVFTGNLEQPLRFVSIRRIEVEEDWQESVCIRVEAEDHLYVTKDFIVTHCSTGATT